MQRVAIISLVFLVITQLSGCFGFSSKPDADDEPQYYVVDVNRASIAKQFEANRVILLKPIKITPHFRGKTLIFRVGEDSYQQQVPHQFLANPSAMFSEQLKRWLQKTGLFSRVVTDHNQQADLVLETAITSLYGEQRTQFSPQSVIEMQFFLYKNDQQQQAPIFQTGFNVEVDIAETTPAHVVSGWKQGLERIFTTLEQDLSDYFSKP